MTVPPGMGIPPSIPPRTFSPPRFTRAGGPYTGGDFRFTWQGARVLAIIDAATETALQGLGAELQATLERELHRYPKHTVHQLAPLAFAEVVIRAGRRTMIWGSRAFFALWHEFGTRWFAGHAQFREIGGRMLPTISARIRQALAAQKRQLRDI